jgi:hypothetical protein
MAPTAISASAAVVDAVETYERIEDEQARQNDLQHFGSPPTMPTACSDHRPVTSQRCSSERSARRRSRQPNRFPYNADRARLTHSAE